MTGRNAGRGKCEIPPYPTMSRTLYTAGFTEVPRLWHGGAGDAWVSQQSTVVAIWLLARSDGNLRHRERVTAGTPRKHSGQTVCDWVKSRVSWYDDGGPVGHWERHNYKLATHDKVTARMKEHVKSMAIHLFAELRKDIGFFASSGL